jgi:outer membrane murein-binding lipoprotein Lpp
MSNWFSDHPATTIIGHTILVGTVVCAATYFVLDENKVNDIKAQVDQYKAKTEFLEDQITQLRDENKKYLEWLSGTPNTIPYFEQKIKTLKDAIHPKKIIGHINETLEDDQVSITGTVAPYAIITSLNVGDAWVDPKTNLTFGVNQVFQDFTANALIGIPGGEEQELKQVKPGKSWTFTKGAKQYQFVVKNINWYTNKVEVELREIVDSSKNPSDKK